MRFGTICTMLRVKKTHEGVLLLVKLQAETLPKATLPWVFQVF